MCALCFAALAAATTGPFSTTHKTFKYSELDITDHGIEAVYPTGQGTTGTAFPVISYAHGLGDGGGDVMDHYSGSTHPLLEELASWGYVVLAPRSCNDGCLLSCKTLKSDPPCFGHFYDQQLKTIDWARSPAAAEAGLPINTSLVAVAGHSMGGQATLFSAAYNATSHGIKAAALHHAYTHSYPAIPNIPHLIFTGTHDTTAPPQMADSIFNAVGAFAIRGLVNKAGAKHDEPGGGDGGAAYNPMLPIFTVAWFKIFVDETPVWKGHDFHAMVYGQGSDSLCGGGDGAMGSCTILPAAPGAHARAPVPAEADEKEEK
jgi:hypothetical protein